VFGGLTAAERMHSASSLRMVREAFVYGMDSALLVSAGIAVAGLFVALAFMPQRTARVEDVAEYHLNPPFDLAEEPGVMV
jgi:hypothetical protein